MDFMDSPIFAAQYPANLPCEDTFATLLSSNEIPISVLGIFDGHGGPETSLFLQKRLPSAVQKALAFVLYPQLAKHVYGSSQSQEELSSTPRTVQQHRYSKEGTVPVVLGSDSSDPELSESLGSSFSTPNQETGKPRQNQPLPSSRSSREERTATPPTPTTPTANTNFSNLPLKNVDLTYSDKIKQTITSTFFSIDKQYAENITPPPKTLHFHSFRNSPYRVGSTAIIAAIITNPDSSRLIVIANLGDCGATLGYTGRLNPLAITPGSSSIRHKRTRTFTPAKARLQRSGTRTFSPNSPKSTNPNLFDDNLIIKPKSMAIPHNTHNKAEVARIRTWCSDPKPLIGPRVAGYLLITRSFGNIYLKDPKFAPGPLKKHVPYISTTPTIEIVYLPPKKRVTTLQSLVLQTNPLRQRQNQPIKPLDRPISQLNPFSTPNSDKLDQFDEFEDSNDSFSLQSITPATPETPETPETPGNSITFETLETKDLVKTKNASSLVYSKVPLTSPSEYLDSFDSNITSLNIEFLILASDGFWDHWTEVQAVTEVRKYYLALSTDTFNDISADYHESDPSLSKSESETNTKSIQTKDIHKNQRHHIKPSTSSDVAQFLVSRTLEKIAHNRLDQLLQLKQGPQRREHHDDITVLIVFL